MKRSIAFVSTGVASVVLAVGVAGSVLAWHPVGKISKQVQNVTQGSALSEANNASQAVAVKPGDTVKYVITVRNDGQKHNRGWNDMHYTKVTDNLPAGVTLVSGATHMNLGHIAAGASKKYEFIVKVTSQKDGDVICNTASFTGDSEVKDAPQRGSDSACIKVNVPPKPVEKMIEVCYKGKGPQMHKIKESQFDAKTMSKNPADCKKPEEPKPVEKMIEVCYKDKGPKMHKIKESEFDSKTMSKNPEDCKKPEVPKPEEPKPEAPKPVEKPVEKVVELPETGAASLIAQVLGVGSTAAAGVAYWRSRR